LLGETYKSLSVLSRNSLLIFFCEKRIEKEKSSKKVKTIFIAHSNIKIVI